MYIIYFIMSHKVILLRYKSIISVDSIHNYLVKRTDIMQALFVRHMIKQVESTELRLTPRSIQRIIKK